MEKELHNLFKQWCKETGRSGGVLMGSSVREFLSFLAIKLEKDGHRIRNKTDSLSDEERVSNQ